MADRRVKAVVTGRVQGVFYRASTEQEARRLGLGGWVRNLPDGRVELEAQGPDEDVEALIAWTWRGPEHAQVDHVEVTEVAAQPVRGGFEVKR